jgi:HEAT repeat protein
VLDLRYWEDLLPQVPAEPGGKIQSALEIICQRVSQYIDGHISKLRGDDAATRRQGEEVIRHLRAERLKPHVGNLIDCLGSPNAANVRGTVVAALDGLGVETVPALHKALGDANTQRRLACIAALARLGPAAAAAVPDLQQFMATPRLRREVKRAAQEALGGIAPAAGQTGGSPGT